MRMTSNAASRCRTRLTQLRLRRRRSARVCWPTPHHPARSAYVDRTANMAISSAPSSECSIHEACTIP
jgi:hypothetical protein